MSALAWWPSRLATGLLGVLLGLPCPCMLLLYCYPGYRDVPFFGVLPPPLLCGGGPFGGGEVEEQSGGAEEANGHPPEGLHKVQTVAIQAHLQEGVGVRVV
eukprot:5645122-Pyramimonas_sp.AAC.1